MNTNPGLLLFGSQMETGGAQRLLLDQAHWFTANGWQVTAVFLYDKEGLHERWQQDAPFPIINLEAKLPGKSPVANVLALIKGIGRLLRLMRTQRFDAIETFTHHPNLIGLPLAWLSRIPVRVGSHHGRIQNFPKLLEKLHAWVVNTFATSLVSVCKNIQQQAIEEGVHENRTAIIHNGVELAQPAPDIVQQKRKSLAKDDGMFILTAGRMSYQKAQTYFLQAAARIIEKHPTARFALAGDGDLRAELEKETRTLGITDHVQFLGIRSDLPDLMAAADIFALTSRSEGLPIVLLEAMSVGTPIIGSRIVGIEEVITDHKDGELFESENVDELVAALESLITDADLRQKLGAAGQETVKAGYTIDIMCRQYAELLNPSP